MPSSSRLEEQDVRVEDYLNDKLQYAADLDTLDGLLASVREHQELLREQLSDAQTAHSEVRRELDQHVGALEQQAHEFREWQRDIDRRLLVVTQSDTSDEAVPRFEANLDKLRRLDVADGYVKLLQDVDQLSKDSASQLSLSPNAALDTYARLQHLAASLRPLHTAAEGAAPHVLDHVERTTQGVWRQIKDASSADLQKVLTRMAWPKVDVTITKDYEREWNDAVGKLLDLQKPELLELVRDENDWATRANSNELVVLLPLEVMVQPLEMRFKYHFEGDRPTNRLDKPEYFLSHVIHLLNTYSPFFVAYLQPILLDNFRGTDIALYPAFIDATSAFITALLPMLRAKIYFTVKQASSQPQLLSHIMHEIMEFDRTLREEWAYDGVYRVGSWKGLSWDVLVTKDWFGRWFQVEKDFALSRYQDIINASDSGDLDFDSVEPNSTKPTKAAIRVNDLVESVTDRYRLLQSFSQKLRFLMDIQISIFDKYYERLYAGLEAYLAMTSPIARTVQGVSKEEQASLQGIGGLERLCRVFGSADYLERAMRDWSDDVFFLELWDELQERAKSRPVSKVAREMTLDEIAERTSSAVNSGANDGALFDETANAYNRLRIRSEAIIVDTLIYSLREALRPYGRINQWSSLSHEYGKPTSSATSTELDQVVAQLSSYLPFLARCLAAAPLRRICRQLLLSMQTYIWDHVLVRNSFSSAGSAQLATDVAAITKTVDSSLGQGYGQQCLRKLVEAVRLLALPVQGKDDDGAPLGLWGVEKRLFADNDSARAVLEELGLHSLTESEARHVLERRVELGS